MARLDDGVLAALLLTSPLAGEGPPPLKARKFWALVAEVGDLAPLLTEVPADRPDADRLRTLLGRATAFAFSVEEAERQGITLLSALDPRYPARLRAGMGAQAPPVLHTVGPLEWLSGPCVAIAAEGGAAVDDESTLGAVRAAARQVASDGHTALTGGFATAVDAAASTAALDAGGAVIALLAHPLTAHLRRAEVRRAVHGGRLCLATPFRPDAPWSHTTDAGRATVAAALAERVVTIPDRAPTLLDDAPP
ncbi:MAG: DNA-processing protein DprA [Acidimicrobiales bacterium]|nr:DNA-processing protein DprA [Acidimicrobiales bacterium]